MIYSIVNEYQHENKGSFNEGPVAAYDERGIEEEAEGSGETHERLQ